MRGNRALIGIFTLLALAKVPATWANTAFTYGNGTRDLYEIVIASNSDDSKLAPGIYKIDPKSGETAPAVLGEVLGANRSYKGILAPASSDQSKDATFDVFTIVDQQIVIVNNRSTANSPDSRLQIGGTGKNSVSLSDIVSGTIVDIPKISSLDDVHIFNAGSILPCNDLPRGGTVFFLSTKLPSPIGEGLTFGFIVEGVNAKSPKPKVFKNQAWILGYGFQDSDSLARLVATPASFGQIQNDGRPNLKIFAPSIIAKLKNKVRAMDQTDTTRGWFEQLAQYEDYLSGGKIDIAKGVSLTIGDLAAPMAGVPQIDFITLKETLPVSPFDTIYTDPDKSVIGEVYEPMTQTWKLVSVAASGVGAIGVREIGGQQVKFMNINGGGIVFVGSSGVDREPASGKYLFVAEDEKFGGNKAASEANAAEVSDPAYFFFSNGQPYFMVKNLGSSSPNEFQTIPFNVADAPTVTDKISFVRRRLKVNGQNQQVFMVLRRKQGAKKAQVLSMIVEEAHALRPLATSVLYDGPAMTAAEMQLRLRTDGDDLIFDNISPVKGESAYLLPDPNRPASANGDNSVPIKTVPYLRVTGQVDGKPNQVYLQEVSKIAVVRSFLYFRSYDPRGAQTPATGFYLLPKSAQAKVAGEEFYPGYPLINKQKKSEDDENFVMQGKVLRTDDSSSVRFPATQISCFPFTDKSPAPTAKKVAVADSDKTTAPEMTAKAGTPFKIGLAVTPYGDRYTDTVDGSLAVLEMPLPYESLVYTQIIQGTKAHANEFFFLMSFKASPEIKNSQDALYVASGQVKWGGVADDRISVTITQPVVIQNELVPADTVKSHLLLDAEGTLYWVGDIKAPRNSPAARVSLLSAPQKSLTYQAVQRLELREPDSLDETEVAFTRSGRMLGGRWTITDGYGLERKVEGFRAFLEKKYKNEKPKKKLDDEKDGPVDNTEKNAEALRIENQMLAEFGTYLDALVAGDSADRMAGPRVLLVDPALVDKFRMTLFTKLLESRSGFSLRDRRTEFSYADGSLDDVEVALELRQIAKQNANSGKALLYVEPALLKGKEITVRMKADGSASAAKPNWADEYGFNLDDPADEEKDEQVFTPEEAAAPANLAVLLASNGQVKSAAGFKALGARVQTAMPMLSIMSPADWRAIQEANAAEEAVGVLDNFSLDSRFLTSSWTMWPPGTDKAPEDLKAISNIPYRAEEMRVFPTLDRLLVEAAQGGLAGKQKIIIVPAELKAVVQKLLLARWATDDPIAGPWNYANSKLALYRIMGKDPDQQSSVIDNYRALRGAAKTHNAVLIGDLASIVELGRPTNGKSGESFTIYDPVLPIAKTLIDEGTSSTGAKDGQEPTSSEEFQTVASVKIALNNAGLILSTIQNEIKSVQADGANASNPTLQTLYKAFEGQSNHRAQLLSRLQELGDGNAPQSRVAANDRSAYPHMIYWVAAEGQPVQPESSADWNLETYTHPRAATILIGTQQDLERIEAQTAFERKFFDIRKHFDVTTLEAPSEETKFTLVQQLFDRPEFRAMDVQFVLNSPNGRDPREQIIYHFINRIEQVAHDQNIERTTAFVRSYIALQTSLGEDLGLRRDRVIDERFVERLFTRVFPMPLNPDILEPNDWLLKLRNQNQAVRDLQAAGYAGSQDLKRRVFDTMISQTRQADGSRPIPNSQILFGTTSTGKTFLLQSLFKMLKLVEYDPTKASNTDADYIIINCAKITDTETNDPDKISIDALIAQIYDLLSQPKGARAHIVFDDFHKSTTKKVRETLAQFFQGLFEAKNGMILVKSKDPNQAAREIPVQNLNLYMTLNPVSSEKVRAEFVSDKHKGPELLKREVLAAISGEGFTPEESILARWSDIINLDLFPRSAKVPELVKRVRQSSRNGQMILVDSPAIDALIDLFPSAHARAFLTPASSALTNLPSTVERAPLYIRTVRDRALDSGTDKGPADSGINSQELATAVRNVTQIEPIQMNDPKSLLNLIGFVMRNFRLQVFNYVSLEAHMSDTLRLDRPGMANLLKSNFLLAMANHVMDKARIPTGEITIRPDQYGFYSRPMLEEFIRQYGELKEDDAYFPINMELQERPEDMNLDNFRDGRVTPSSPIRSRRAVLSRTVAKLESILTQAMQVYLRLGSPADVRAVGNWNAQQVSGWFEKLPEGDPEEAFRAVAQQLLNAYLEFSDEFNSADVNDLMPSHPDFSLNLFDEIRLFSFALDKAVLRLPWGQIGNFTLKVATESSDLSLGTRTSFRSYVSNDQLSPFAIVSPEFMKEMKQVARATGGPAMSDAAVINLADHFKRTCANLLGAQVETVQ